MRKLFQYIICCWFKGINFKEDNTLFNFNTLYVVGSNLDCITLEPIFVSYFNTLYVVGSNVNGFITYIPDGFQYIICCWFNQIVF